MNKPATMKDVARSSGFAVATVSLALRGNLKIPEATRTVIQQAAHKLGYQADPMLAALSSHRWRKRPAPAGTTLALLADGPLEGQAGMIERAATYGYRTEIFQIGDWPDPGRLSERLVARGILGVGVGQIFTPGFCAAFDWSRFVAVAVGEGRERPPVNLVMPNHFLAMQEGWDHAVALGYRRIGLAIYEDPNALDYHDRCAAFMERQRQMPRADRVPIMTLKPSRRGVPKITEAQRQVEWQKFNKKIRDWLKRHQPEVVLGFNNSFLWYIRSTGWRVPQQVAFISLWTGTDAQSEMTSGMELSPDEVGRRGIDLLDSLMRSGQRGIPMYPATMSIDMRWQDGETAPGVKRKKRSV